MYVLGIDPGATTGGWAILDWEGNFVGRGKNEDALAGIRLLVPLADIRLAGLELIQSQGRDAGRRYAAANLRENFGFWRGVLEAWEIPYKLQAPQTWQAFYNLIISAKFTNDSQKRTAKKHLIIGRAKLLFPGAGISRAYEDGQAAALLLAYYTLTTEAGGAKWDRGKSWRKSSLV